MAEQGGVHGNICDELAKFDKNMVDRLLPSSQLQRPIAVDDEY